MLKFQHTLVAAVLFSIGSSSPIAGPPVKLANGKWFNGARFESRAVYMFTQGVQNKLVKSRDVAVFSEQWSPSNARGKYTAYAVLPSDNHPIEEHVAMLQQLRVPPGDQEDQSPWQLSEHCARLFLSGRMYMDRGPRSRQPSTAEVLDLSAEAAN